MTLIMVKQRGHQSDMNNETIPIKDISPNSGWFVGAQRSCRLERTQGGLGHSERFKRLIEPLKDLA